MPFNKSTPYKFILDKNRDADFKFPLIDHAKYYLQRGESSSDYPLRKLVVSYHYINERATNQLNNLQSRYPLLQYYSEEGRWGNNGDLRIIFMIIACSDVNLEEAIAYCRNHHDNRFIPINEESDEENEEE